METVERRFHRDVRTNGKNGGRRKQQWWWNEDVRNATKEKREPCKAVESESGDKKQKEILTRKYREIKNEAKKVVARARQETERKGYEFIENDRGRKQIYRLAKAREREEKDVVAPQGISSKDGVVVTSHPLVMSVWKTYFQDLLKRNGRLICEMPCSVRRVEDEKEIEEEEVVEALKKNEDGKIGRQGRDHDRDDESGGKNRSSVAYQVVQSLLCPRRNSGRLENWYDCADLERKRKYTRSGEIPRYYHTKPSVESAGTDHRPTIENTDRDRKSVV